MNDFKLMAKILSAIKTCEQERRTDLTLFDSVTLKTDDASRDAMVAKLQEDGYVDGFCIVDDVDNQQYPVVVYNDSRPRITIKGMEFIEENKPLRKAIEELKAIVRDVAAARIGSAILML